MGKGGGVDLKFGVPVMQKKGSGKGGQVGGSYEWGERYLSREKRRPLSWDVRWERSKKKKGLGENVLFKSLGRGGSAT